MGVELDDEIIGRRLRKAVEGKMQFKDAAAVAGVSPKTFSRWLAGQQSADAKGLLRLAAHLQRPLEEIVAGIERLESGDWETVSADDEEDGFVKVPLLDVQASAGPGAINSDVAPITAIKFRADWLEKRNLNTDDLHAIRVRGDSMEPTLKNGDLIVVDVGRTAAVDGIFVIGYDEDILVKRLQRLSPTRLVIASDNPLAGSTEIDLRDETQHPRIIGRVIWLGRDL